MFMWRHADIIFFHSIDFFLIFLLISKLLITIWNKFVCSKFYSSLSRFRRLRIIMNNGKMTSVPLSSAEHDCLMTEVQIRSTSTPTTTTTTKTHKHSKTLLKAHLCQNKLTLGLCLSLLLSIAIVISLFFIYIVHTRTRSIGMYNYNFYVLVYFFLSIQ